MPIDTQLTRKQKKRQRQRINRGERIKETKIIPITNVDENLSPTFRIPYIRLPVIINLDTSNPLSYNFGLPDGIIREIAIKTIVIEKKDPIENIEIRSFSKHCIICYDEFQEDDKLVVLKCGHTYHKNCITDFLDKKNKCAYCLQN